MSITRKFDEVPYDLTRDVHGGGRDPHAQLHLLRLRDVSSRSPESTYVRSSWGYTILRTTYTEESDALLPLALEKLQRWITHFWLHANRFPYWGQKGIDRQVADGTLNEELGRRLCFEVVEDPNDPRLNLPYLSSAKQYDVKSLVGVFKAWVASVGMNHDQPPAPRFWDFLVLDRDSLKDLMQLPDETPPLRPAQDLAEKRDWKGDGNVFVWLCDPLAVQNFDDNMGPRARGWMKLDISDIEDAWFTRARIIGQDQSRFTCSESPDTPGEFWYDGV